MAPFPKIDLNLIRVFMVVYSTRNLKEAAEVLNITQPAVSNALRRLNDSLGQTLFVRNGRKIVASKEGQAMHQRIKLPYEQLVQGLREDEIYSPKESERVFRISLSLYFDSLMPRLAKIIESDAPNVSVEGVPFRPSSNLHETASGKLDLMLLARSCTSKNLKRTPIGTDQMVLVARPGHPQINGYNSLTTTCAKNLRFASLSREYELTIPAYSALRNHNASVFVRTADFNSLLEIVSTTYYVALVPQIVVGSSSFRIQILPSPFPQPDIPLELICAKHQEEDAGNRWLSGVLRDLISRDVSQHSYCADLPLLASER